MLAVLDTNVVVSAFLWRGAPHRLLVAASQDKLRLFTSALLMEELRQVLDRPKFRQRLIAASLAPEDLVAGYVALSYRVNSVSVATGTVQDPDDAEVLGCALAAKVDLIVSGDHHLLTLGLFQNIPIITPAGAHERLDQSAA